VCGAWCLLGAADLFQTRLSFYAYHALFIASLLSCGLFLTLGCEVGGPGTHTHPPSRPLVLCHCRGVLGVAMPCLSFLSPINCVWRVRCRCRCRVSPLCMWRGRRLFALARHAHTRLPLPPPPPLALCRHCGSV
jgi:hypothetical protein